MGQVAARLGLDAAYVVFGHTHRAGPLPRDDEREWRVANRAAAADAAAAGAGAGATSGLGARLVNAGCWTYQSAFLSATPGESPYWPGTCVVVEDAGARRARALQHRPRPTGGVRPAVAPRAVLALGHEPGAGHVLGAQRLERLSLEAHELLDRELGLLIGALAVVVLHQARVTVEQ